MLAAGPGPFELELELELAPGLSAVHYESLHLVAAAAAGFAVVVLVVGQLAVVLADLDALVEQIEFELDGDDGVAVDGDESGVGRGGLGRGEGNNESGGVQCDEGDVLAQGIWLGGHFV